MGRRPGVGRSRLGFLQRENLKIRFCDGVWGADKFENSVFSGVTGRGWGLKGRRAGEMRQEGCGGQNET